MVRKLAVMMALAMVIAIAGVAYGAGSAAADEPVPPFTTPEDDLEDIRQFAFDNGSYDDGPLYVDSDGSGAGATGTSSVAQSITLNPWGCAIEAHSPHESSRDPGLGYVQAKATIECDTDPPAGYVATILQDLSRWEGSESVIMAVNYSVCPARTGIPIPKCFSGRNDGKIMEAYVNVACEIGETYRWVHLAEATLTVEGIIYSGVSARARNVPCDGP